MEFKNEDEVVKLIKGNLKPPTWVVKSRDSSKILDALITGKDYLKVLIEKIEGIESEKLKIARERYSKDVRDLYHRVMQPRINVFTASGGSVYNEISSETLRRKFNKSLNHFKGQKSITKYFSEDFFRLGDVDPNGLIFLEYKEDIDIFPTYKSINDIRVYKSNGQLLEWVIFEPKIIIKSGITIIEWRVVDSKTDWRFTQIGSDGAFVLNKEKTFDHPFGNVPAIILSDIQEVGSELRISSIYPIEELIKDYGRDKSIRGIYKFQNGFPRHGRYVDDCRRCQGTGTIGEKVCGHCDNGVVRRNDVTDIQEISFPRDSDSPVVAPNLEWFTSPDLKTWTQYNEDLESAGDLIESTTWGTSRVKKGGGAETATGRFIDVQPVKNRLDIYADNAEWSENQLSRFVENWVYGEPRKESEYHKTYGRIYIIESPDVIFERYSKAVSDGVNSVILDKILDEYILTAYQNDNIMLDEMQKRREIEPYIHSTIESVKEVFGVEEAQKKVMFADYWIQADKTKTREDLKKEFQKWYINNKTKTIENESFSGSE